VPAVSHPPQPLAYVHRRYFALAGTIIPGNILKVKLVLGFEELSSPV